jgi:hypothetical protein
VNEADYFDTYVSLMSSMTSQVKHKDTIRYFHIAGAHCPHIDRDLKNFGTFEGCDACPAQLGCVSHAVKALIVYDGKDSRIELWDGERTQQVDE